MCMYVFFVCVCVCALVNLAWFFTNTTLPVFLIAILWGSLLLMRAIMLEHTHWRSCGIVSMYLCCEHKHYTYKCTQLHVNVESSVRILAKEPSPNRLEHTLYMY